MTTAQHPPETDDPVDRLLIAALSAGETRVAAAARAGVSPSTLSRRLRTPAFRAALSDARQSVFAVPLANATRLLPLGLTRLERILADDAAPLSAVVRAAETVTNIAIRLSAPAAELAGRHAVEASVADREEHDSDRRAAKQARPAEVPAWLPGRLSAAAGLIADQVREYLNTFAAAPAAEQETERAELLSSIRELLAVAARPPAAPTATPTGSGV